MEAPLDQFRALLSDCAVIRSRHASPKVCCPGLSLDRIGTSLVLFLIINLALILESHVLSSCAYGPVLQNSPSCVNAMLAVDS